MSATGHLHPHQFGEQLAMFMTGPEIKAMARPGDALGIQSQEKFVWERKLAEAHNSGLHLSIAHEGGVHTPVAIGPPGARPSYLSHITDDRPTLVNGHHRVISEVEYAPHRLLPVKHVSGYGREAFPSDSGSWSRS